MDGGDGFSLDDLKRAATGAAAEVDPADIATARVPLRGRGYFVPYARAAREVVEMHEANNLKRGLPALPYEEYCYMCASYDVKNTNPHRRALQEIFNLVLEMQLSRVCALAALYHQKHVEPHTRKSWSYHSIFTHATEHTINPAQILTESIRGVQVHINVHVESMEVEETPEAEGEGADAEGAEGSDLDNDNDDADEDLSTTKTKKKSKKRKTSSPTSSVNGDQPQKKRRIDLKEEQAFMQLVRLQKSLVESLHRMRSEHHQQR